MYKEEYETSYTFKSKILDTSIKPCVVTPLPGGVEISIGTERFIFTQEQWKAFSWDIRPLPVEENEESDES